MDNQNDGSPRAGVYPGAGRSQISRPHATQADIALRHRTVRTKGCLSHGTTLAMVFKLITTASKTWRRLMGNNQLPKVIEGVRFKDGMQIDETKTRAAA